MMSPFIRTTMKPFYSCSELPPFTACCSSSNGCSCSYQQSKNTSSTVPTCLLNSMHPETSKISQGYFVQVQIPDRVGVFTLRIIFKRPGYIPLLLEKHVVVRHFSHQEYPRLIPVSYPYYIIMLSMLFAGILFASVMLYYRKKEEHQKKDSVDFQQIKLE